VHGAGSLPSLSESRNGQPQWHRHRRWQPDSDPGSVLDSDPGSVSPDPSRAATVQTLAAFGVLTCKAARV
jgi:hypothetical protein